jgi:hypothetical protein
MYQYGEATTQRRESNTSAKRIATFHAIKRATKQNGNKRQRK